MPTPASAMPTATRQALGDGDQVWRRVGWLEVQGGCGPEGRVGGCCRLLEGQDDTDAHDEAPVVGSRRRPRMDESLPVDGVVGRSDSDRLRTSADRQTMATGGAFEQVGKAKTSGRKADEVLYDWNGGAEGALPDVDRPEPVVATVRAGMRDMMDFQAAPPLGGAMPTSGGDTGGGGGADGVADGVADDGMPAAYKWGPTGQGDRTRPMAKLMMMKRTPGRAVRTSNLPGAPEWSTVQPWVWR